jgi:DNA repair exonuclease SbcCD ATPase subunit
MALDDAQEKELKEKLAKIESELAELKKEQIKKIEDDKSKTPPGEKPPKPDPDTAKTIAELQKDMAEIKAKLGSGTSAKKSGLPNFWGK